MASVVARSNRSMAFKVQANTSGSMPNPAAKGQFGYPALMPVTKDYLQYVLEQLARLPGVTSRRMFGGIGLYSEGVFFGIIDNDALFFKVDDSTRESYTSRGSEPFRPYKDRPEVSMSYFQVPADVLEDADELVPWARTAVRAAAASAQTKRAASKRAGRKTPPRGG